MEISQRQRAQGHSANPGRSRTRTHLSGQVPCFFFKIVVSSDVQFWMSPEGPAISSIQDGEPGGPNSW